VATAACGINGAAGILLGSRRAKTERVNGAACFFENAPYYIRDPAERNPQLEAPLAWGIVRLGA
jgi:hypothetical protein